MSKLSCEIIPSECLYCKNTPSQIITKRMLLRRTEVFVCDKCAKEIWEQETNRMLPGS